METTFRSGNNSKWQACMRETVADRSWQAGHGEPWTSKRDERGRSNERYSCLVTALHSLSRGPGEMCSHIPLKEWNQIRSARCPKPHGKREISDMNEDLGNHSKDQLYYLTHWLDISQNSEKNKAKIHQFGKKLIIVTRNFIGYALFAGGIWEKYILITDIEELEKKRWSIK